MRYRRALVAVMVLAAGCSDSTTGPSGQNGAMSATINGSSWTSSQGATVTRTAGAAPILSIGGSDGTLSVGIAWSDNGVGTYPIGPGSPTVVFLTTGSAGWSANATVGSGSVTVTAIDATRVAGIFNFVAPATPGTSATGTRTATNGQFDIAF